MLYSATEFRVLVVVST